MAVDEMDNEVDMYKQIDINTIQRGYPAVHNTEQFKSGKGKNSGGGRGYDKSFRGKGVRQSTKGRRM